MANEDRSRDGYVLIFRRFITRNGVRDDAWRHGKKAWPIWVKADQKR